MKVRVVFLDALMILLLASLSFYLLVTWGPNAPVIGLGAVLGSVSGAAIGLIQTRILDKKGEIKMNFIAVALIIGCLLIVLYLIFTFGPILSVQMLNFVYPWGTALYAGRMISYLNWERTHNRFIMYDGLVITRVYAQDLKDNLQYKK